MEQATLHPKENIQQLLIRLVPEYISALENEQMAVLRNLQAKYLNAFKSKEEQKAFTLILYETAQWIHDESGKMPFKCKTFYRELKNILSLPIFKDKELVKSILKDAKRMPQSTENANAFIVKYSKRTPREIVEQLFVEPLTTVEHIKPQVAGGKSEAMANLAMACSNCNGGRRGSIPLDEFVEQNPNIEKNIKKQFKKLETEGKRVNAKSIMGMMSLGLDAGQTVTVICDGADEEAAINHIEKYLSGEK